jgi:zinc transporter, ZIP family
MRGVVARSEWSDCDSPMEGLIVFVGALGTALATGLGALPFVFARRPSRSWLGIANSLAAGFMSGASIGLLYEGGRYDVGRTILGALAGGLFIWATGRLIERKRELHLGALEGADALRALLIVGVMTLHSFTEGVGVGVAFGGEETLGLLIAVAIAVHNIPEGLAISLVLVPRGASVRNAAAWSVFSSLPQPLMAVPAFLFVESFSGFLPVGLGFAAGAMLWLVVADLLPEALEATRRSTVALTMAGSALAMLVFLLLLL